VSPLKTSRLTLTAASAARLAVPSMSAGCAPSCADAMAEKDRLLVASAPARAARNGCLPAEGLHASARLWGSAAPLDHRSPFSQASAEEGGVGHRRRRGNCAAKPSAGRWLCSRISRILGGPDRCGETRYDVAPPADVNGRASGNLPAFERNLLQMAQSRLK